MSVPRSTKIIVEGNIICLNKYYDDYTNYKIQYASFRTRIKSFEKRNIAITYDLLTKAISLDSWEWKILYGGGHKKKFIYKGTYFKECINVQFNSLSAFIYIIGEYENYSLINSRIKHNWDIDKAIFKEIIDSSFGRIYIIKCKLNNLVYVGQTINSIEDRFEEHIHLYKTEKRNNSLTRKLYLAFDQYGIQNFYIELLEDNIPNEKKFITNREEYWINKLKALNSKNVLNMKVATRSSAGRGNEIIYQEVKYNSIKQAIKILHKNNPNCPKHIIERCIRNNVVLPENPRYHSKHPEAGSNLWRRWKGLKRSGNICDEWNTEDDSGYEQFKYDIGLPPTQNHNKIGRIDITKKHSRSNSRWMTSQELINTISGNPITVYGKTYPTYQSVAKEYGIKLNTLIYRINNGLSPEESVKKELKTSPKLCVYDNIKFKSRSKMFEYISKKFNITFGQAKDRYERNLPFEHIPFTGNKCIVLGINFNSEKDAVLYYKVSYSSYNKLKAKGFTPEKAITILLSKKKNTEKYDQFELFK